MRRSIWPEENELFDRSGEEWSSALAGVAEEDRPAVARCVWWDFASIYTRDIYEKRGFQIFDKFLKWQAEVPDDEKVIAGLMAVGYSPDRAATRVWRAAK
jgi:hypothetical protein